MFLFILLNVAMQNTVQSTLANLAPGFYVNFLTIFVDRIFVHKTVRSVDEDPRQVKDFNSVDMLCWDKVVYFFSILLLFVS